MDINLTHVTPPVTFLRFVSTVFKLFDCLDLLCFKIFHQQEMDNATNILELLEKKLIKCWIIVVKIGLKLVSYVLWLKTDFNLTAPFHSVICRRKFSQCFSLLHTQSWNMTDLVGCQEPDLQQKLPPRIHPNPLFLQPF